VSTPLVFAEGAVVRTSVVAGAVVCTPLVAGVVVCIPLVAGVVVCIPLVAEGVICIPPVAGVVICIPPVAGVVICIPPVVGVVICIPPVVGVVIGPVLSNDRNFQEDCLCLPPLGRLVYTIRIYLWLSYLFIYGFIKKKYHVFEYDYRTRYPGISWINTDFAHTVPAP